MMKRAVGIGGLTVLVMVSGAAAQAPVDGTRPEPPVVRGEERQPGMPELEVDCEEVETFGGTPHERAGWCLAERQRHASARTMAQKALAQDPDSYRAHFLMGYAQHLGEGNLPKALFHLERAEALFGRAHGVRPDRETAPWRVYHRILRELVYVHGEMDHHEEKIAYVDALSDRLELDYEPLKAWPLLKLKRFEEARQVATRAADQQESWFRSVGLTALCAIESEVRDRVAAYDACALAAREVEASATDGAIELSNAGAASEEMFRFDEAERYYVEATRRIPEGSVNPWGRLVRLYLSQGRHAEALSAWREMRDYRKRRPATYLDQQDQAEAELIGAAVLLVAGRAKDAVRVTTKTTERPDRQGTSSANEKQNAAGAAVTDRVVKLTAARQLEEEASFAPFGESLGLRLRALRLRFEAWLSGRRAAEALADHDLLITSLRPECPGSVELPDWLDPEIVHLVGPGVSLAALEEARRIETLPAALSEPVFRYFEAEARWLMGDREGALAAARAAIDRLPASEVLIRARVSAIAADAAAALGAHDEALALYRAVLGSDPGVLRRLGLRLPVRVVPSGGGAEAVRAAEMLSSSPMFASSEVGFTLAVGSDVVLLLTEDRNEIARVHVPPGRADGVEEVARRIARAVHRELFVPNVDITQADVRSLDGSLGTGGRASDRAKEVFEEVTGEPEAPE